MLTNAKPHVQILHITNKIKKYTNPRWLISAKAHLVFAPTAGYNGRKPIHITI